MATDYTPDLKHSDYLKYAPFWEKIRDVVAGESDVKAKGQLYLPRELGMSPEAYKAFKEGAFFLAACDRTVEAFVGLIHRKPATVEGQEAIPEDLWYRLTNNFTRRGLSIADTAYKLTSETAILNRAGILLDYPTVKGSLSKLEYEQKEIYPFARLYTAEEIINWGEYEKENGRTELEFIVLAAPFLQRDPENEFKSMIIERYYVHDLVKKSTDDGTKGVYRKRIFVKNDKNTWDVEEAYPVINGKLLTQIPFWFVGGYNSSDVEQSALLPVVDTNIKHYRLCAQLNWGLKFIALPTPYATGIHNKDELEVEDPISGEKGIPIGPSFFHTVASPDAKFGLLTYEGKGLELLQKEIENRRDEMAMLGSRLLTSEKRQVETAETARIYRTGENAALSTTAHSVSVALTACLKKAFEWVGVDPKKLEDFKYTLNTDYLPSEMDSNLFANLFRSYLEGALPLKDFFDKLKEGEILDPERDYDEFKADLKESRKYLGLDTPPPAPGTLPGNAEVRPGTQESDDRDASGDESVEGNELSTSDNGDEGAVEDEDA